MPVLSSVEGPVLSPVEGRFPMVGTSYGLHLSKIASLCQRNNYGIMRVIRLSSFSQEIALTL